MAEAILISGYIMFSIILVDQKKREVLNNVYVPNNPLSVFFFNHQNAKTVLVSGLNRFLPHISDYSRHYEAPTYFSFSWTSYLYAITYNLNA